MPQPRMKGIVPTPIEIPAHVLAERSKIKKAPEIQIPLMIKLFAWFCVLRASVYLVFALIEGLEPQSSIAAWVTEKFDTWPKQASPEAVFYILAALYGTIAFRWFMRDWKARWGTMVVTGASAAKVLADLVADKAAGISTLPPGAETTVVVSAILNLFICAYLAFYPGVEQAFSETR